MKKFIVMVLMLVALPVYSQTLSAKANLIKTYLNFTATSDDTTGWINIPTVREGVLAREWGIIGVSDDSIQAVVYVVGRNSALLRGTSSYVLQDSYEDSISSLGAGATAWSSIAPKTKVVMLKDNTVNHLEGCNQFRVATTFGVAPSQGTTAGRNMKWYLWYQM